MNQDDRNFVDELICERQRMERRQNRWRIAFIVFVLVFVYAQSFAGRVYMHDELLRGCDRAQLAYHHLRFADIYVKCDDAYPAPVPWPW